jgi:glycosyltransferase involved in cell wall biosynthesis
MTTYNPAAEVGRAQQLRIEMVLPSLAVAGMEVMTCDLARGLSARGHQVGVTCLEAKGDLAEDLARGGVRASYIAVPGFGPNLRPDRALQAHFAKLGCQVVHTHNGVWAKAAMAARAACIPVVNTFHGFAHGEPQFYEWLRWWGARYTDRVVAVSNSLREHLVGRTGVPVDRLAVLPNGIDTVRFSPGGRNGALRHRFEIAPDAPIVGCIARLDPVKNHALLLAAFRRVLMEQPKARLVLVGDGPLRDEIQGQVVSLGLAHAVHLAGSCADPAPIYRDLEAFALASTSEGTSISIIEALASGVPVVATAVGGNPDLLSNGECGLLVPTGNEAEMAFAILRILEDRQFAAQLATAGRARAIAAFSLEAMVDAYEALYWSVLEDSRAPVALSR